VKKLMKVSECVCRSSSCIGKSSTKIMMHALLREENFVWRSHSTISIQRLSDFENIFRLPPSADSWLHLQRFGVHGERQQEPLCR